jgi:hypothetical protein
MRVNPNMTPNDAYQELCSILNLGKGPLGTERKAQATEFLAFLMAHEFQTEASQVLTPTMTEELGSFKDVSDVEVLHAANGAPDLDEPMDDETFFATLREAVHPQITATLDEEIVRAEDVGDVEVLRETK